MVHLGAAWIALINLNTDQKSTVIIRWGPSEPEVTQASLQEITAVVAPPTFQLILLPDLYCFKGSYTC